MKFLYDTHVHVAPSSECAKVYGDEVVDAYKKAGHSGFIVTNHVLLNYGDATWEEYVKGYLQPYYKAKECGEQVNVDVYLGMEIYIEWPGSDLLIYGIDEDFLYNNEDLTRLNQKQLFERVDSYGGIMVVAHPFRYAECPYDPKYLHGVEGYNLNLRHIQRNNNDIAIKFAKNNNLPIFAGSDFHEAGDIPSGISFKKRPKDYKEYIQMIKNREYELFIPNYFLNT